MLDDEGKASLNRPVSKRPTGTRSSGGQVERTVRRLQERIYRATERQEWQTCVVCRSSWPAPRPTSCWPSVVSRKQNQGKRTAGVDGKTYLNSAARAALAQEAFSLKGYRPQPVKRVYIPKGQRQEATAGHPDHSRPGVPGDGQGGLGTGMGSALRGRTPTAFDQGAAAWTLSSNCTPALNGKGRSEWVLDADISGCFDHIAHEPLLARIPVFKAVVRRWLKAGVVELGQYQPTTEGTPQGGVISPLAGEHRAGRDGAAVSTAMEARQWAIRRPACAARPDRGVSLVRYADDFVVTAPSREVLETSCASPSWSSSWPSGDWR